MPSRISLRDGEESAREAAAGLVLGTQKLVDQHLLAFEAASGALSDGTKNSLLLEPVFLGSAHLIIVARKVTNAQGVGSREHLGAFVAAFDAKLLFYLALVFDVLPEPVADEDHAEVKFVEPHGYDTVRREYLQWSVVRREQYQGAYSSFGLRVRRLLHGPTHTAALILNELLRRSFAEDQVPPPYPQIAAFTADVLANVEELAKRLSP
ncbi:MAG TPA: hypothetical protein VN380_13335 [Thermoanaerobaculia bacterium]|jgi:hypothetical protein|nr:hypothetical protein [Thermoanaerobaculia bacterium]